MLRVRSACDLCIDVAVVLHHVWATRVIWIPSIKRAKKLNDHRGERHFLRHWRSCFFWFRPRKVDEAHQMELDKTCRVYKLNPIPGNTVGNCRARGIPACSCTKATER